MRPAVLLLCGMLLIVGCARFEYDLVEPPELAVTIGRDAARSVEIEPLEYRMQTADNRLVMWIINPTDQPVELIGHQSSVVDPTGQSRPIQGRMIAPDSFVRLIFPPRRPPAGRAGPSIGVGAGFGTGRGVGVGTGVGVSRPIGGGPRYLAAGDEAFYWEWRDESAVRMIFRYRMDDETFEHRMVFQRRRL